MVSESTARLVENVAVLAEPELVQIKGAELPVPARRLLRTVADPVLAGRRRWTLVGRQWEMRALTGMLDESIAGRGCVAGVIGAPGIGKTRLTRELATIANELGVEVHSTFCEAHETEVPFHVLGRMVRAVLRVTDLDAVAARAIVEARFRAADHDDLLLLEDLIGIGDSAVALPAIEPDARRRRLAQMINTALAGPTGPIPVHHRRCSLDRRDQRDDVRGILLSDPAHPLDGATQLPAGVPRCAGPMAGFADHRARSAQ